MKVAYIVGPYRAKNGRTILENIRAAEAVAIKYWRLGYAVICPHLNTAFFDGLCEDHVWLDGDLEIVKRCDVLVAMHNWKESAGSVRELQLAESIGKEILYDESLQALRGEVKKCS